MRRPPNRLLKLILGWSFIALGVLGLFLPILQGVLFLAIGLGILAQELPWAHRLLTRLRHRYPHMAKMFEDARHKAGAWIHRLTHRRPAGRPDSPDGPLA